MDRRKALIHILKGLLTGAAVTVSASVAATLNPSDYRYYKMVKLQEEVISLHAAGKEEGFLGYGTPDSFKKTYYHMQIDDLLGFSMDNFTGDTKSQEAIEECRKLFNTRDYWDTLDVNQLKQIMDVIVPVAVARNLLARHRLTFNPRNMVHWNRFAERYQDLILNA